MIPTAYCFISVSKRISIKVSNTVSILYYSIYGIFCYHKSFSNRSGDVQSMELCVVQAEKKVYASLIISKEYGYYQTH